LNIYRRGGRPREEVFAMDWSALIAAWGPMLLLIAVWFLLSRWNGMRAKAPSGRNMLELYELQLEQMQRNVAVLERIAVALEQRAKSA
jgi:hypothetical protein